MSYELYVMSGMTCFDAIHANCISVGGVAGVTSVEIMHGKGCITRNLIEALTTRNRFFHFILIVEDLIATRSWLNTACQTEATKFIIKYLIKF